jgi:predicted transposase/invertase (TIGR01784 family)
MGDKFCRLDINMTVDGQRVDLEIQISNEGNYPARSLYYWAREFSAALGEGEDYSKLPRTILVSIVAFELFDCAEFHSEFVPLEVSRHTLLTDKMSLHYFELPKLPKEITKDDELKLWLTLFNAETEEEITKIEEMGVPIMREAIGAYRRVTASPEFRELERMRSKARHDEAQALKNAEQRGEQRAEKREAKKWQSVVADKDAAIADKDALIAELRARLGENK